MRNFLFLLIFISQSVFSQNTKSTNTSVKKIRNNSGIETLAEFPGGEQKFKEYILTSLKLPETEKEIKGEIRLSFVIETDGSLINVKIVKNNLGAEIGQQVINILKLSPKWKPAEKNGEKVRMQSGIPLWIE